MEVAYSEALRGAPGTPCPRRTVHPPNRLETRNWDLLAALPGLWSSSSLFALADHLHCLTGRKHVFFAPSCRAAIAQVLSLLPQQEVVIPAFTCPVVKTAVLIAGKRVIYVDTAPHQLNSTSVQFEKHAKPGRVLIPTHLFGIPTDIERICDLARQRGCVTIEDAAAALGARRNGRLLGTFADVGVFSFERSKRFPAFRGAAVVVNDEQVVSPSRFTDFQAVQTRDVLPIREILFSLMFNAATLPWMYGRFVVPRQLKKYARWSPETRSPGLQDAVRTRAYTNRFHPYQAALVTRMLMRMADIRKRIGRLVSIYMETLRDTPVATFLPNECDHAALLRFPVAIPGAKRSDVLRQALRRGLFLETNYETTLNEEADGSFPNALWLAQNVFLLPLYTALPEQSARRLAQEVALIGSNYAHAVPSR